MSDKEFRTLEEVERIAQDGPDGTYLQALAAVHVAKQLKRCADALEELAGHEQEKADEEWRAQERVRMGGVR